MVSLKEELIEKIRQSPDEEISQLASLLKELQQRQLEIPNILQMLEALPKAQSSEASEPDFSKTVLERMGGEPKHTISVGGLSDRDRRRALISNRLQQKHKSES